MFKERFALSDQGAKDLTKGIVYSVLANISLMLPVALLMVVLRVLLQPVLGGALDTGNTVLYTGLGVGILAVIFLFHYLQYSAAYIGTYRESAVRRISLAERLRKLPLSFFGSRNLSDLTGTLMGDCSSFEHAFSHAVPQLFGSVISTGIICVALLVIDWRMGLAVLWVTPVAFAVILLSRRLQDRLGTRHLQARRDAADGIQEFLETAQDIKACNRQDKVLADLDGLLDAAERAQVSSELTTASLITCGQIFLRLGLATVIVAGSALLRQESISLTTWLLYLMAASRVYDPLSGSLSNIAEIFGVRLQVERLREIERHPVQTGNTDYALNGSDITFEHVGFSYRAEKSVLRDVSFTAKQGEVTALVGPSGGGKSTAAQLAARFWDIDSGRILLGGVDIATIEPEALLRHFSIVFQDVVLFNNTVMENIRLGRKGATDAEVYAAARAACCHDFIEKLPQGYGTMVGENGSTLSGGECQRISIARALLKDAPVILLDEATASLDVDSETQVQQALAALVEGKTVLVIAHRLRTVEGADRIVVLRDGQVEQMGSHKELIQQEGLYRKLSALQREASTWQLGI